MTEDSMLAAIDAHLTTSRATVGRGDDGCVLNPSGRVVVSTDVLVEHVHFRRDWSTPEDIGWRLVAQNVADALAMNARPLSLVVAAVLPPDVDEEWMGRCAAGMDEAAQALTSPPIGIDGGDLSSGATLALTGTILADLEDRDPILRSGARPGQIVAHCGNLGQSEAGLATLLAGSEGPHADLFRRPVPPVTLVLGTGASALMDVSDGLVRDARRLARASGVHVALRTDRLPVPDGVSLDQALYGGEDHGFLATFDSEVPDGWTIIGEVVDGEGVSVDGNDPTRAGGWDHFG